MEGTKRKWDDCEGGGWVGDLAIRDYRPWRVLRGNEATVREGVGQETRQ